MNARWQKVAAGVAVVVGVLAAAHGAATQEKKALREFSLEAAAPEFWNLIAHDAKLEKYAGGFGFTEGPMWDPAGFVYVSDEEKNKIYRAYPDGHSEELVSLGDPDGNTFDQQHRLITTASELRAILAITPDGKYTVLANQYDGEKLNTPNDVI